MRICAPILALALGVAGAPVSAQFRVALTDENIFAQGGKDFLLVSAINAVLFEDARVQGALRRAGLEQGCVLIQAARRQVVDNNRPEFRAHLIAAMRAIVPAERMATSTNLIIGGLGAYRARVTRQVESTGSAVLTRAASEARASALAALGSASPVAPREAAGRFADWRLDRPLSREIACNLVVSSQNRTPEEFASMKRAFDGFYRRSGE